VWTPFGALAEACRKHAMALPADLSAQLSNAGGADALVDLAQGLRRASGRESASVLLVIDQFEELLGRHADHPATQFSLLAARNHGWEQQLNRVPGNDALRFPRCTPS